MRFKPGVAVTPAYDELTEAERCEALARVMGWTNRSFKYSSSVFPTTEIKWAPPGVEIRSSGQGRDDQSRKREIHICPPNPYRIAADHWALREWFAAEGGKVSIAMNDLVHDWSVAVILGEFTGYREDESEVVFDRNSHAAEVAAINEAIGRLMGCWS